MEKALLLCTLLTTISLLSQNQKISPDLWIMGNEFLSTQDHLEKHGDATWMDLSVNTSEFINYNPTLNFELLDGEIQIPFPLDQSNQFTFFTVYQSKEPAIEKGIWNVKNSSRDMVLTTKRITGPGDAQFFEHEASLAPIIHTVTQFWPSSTSGQSTQYFCLGGAGEKAVGVNSFDNSIPEILLFNRKLSNSNRHIIESYLAIKYGIGLEEVDYLNSNGEVIWSNEINDLYNTRITGIGRDDLTGLYQKQSTSSQDPSTLSIGVKEISSTNEKNTGILGNGDFLLWGDNDLPLIFNVLDKKPEQDIFAHRIWKVQSSGHIATLKTEIHLNAPFLEVPPGYQIVLAVDRTGRGEFDRINNLETYHPKTQSNNGKVIFSGVNWDIDGSGYDAFTFSLQPLQQEQVTTFNVGPNPSDGQFQVSISLAEEADVQVNVFDLAGQKIATIYGKQQRDYFLPVTLTHSGEYLIELICNGIVLAKPIVITK